MTKEDREFFQQVLTQQHNNEKDALQQNEQSLFGLPQRYAVIIMLIAGIYFFLEQNKGRSPEEVDTATTIIRIETKLETIEEHTKNFQIAIDQIRTEKAQAHQLIDDKFDQYVPKSQYLKDLQDQAEIDDAQWQSIRDLRETQKSQ